MFKSFYLVALSLHLYNLNPMIAHNIHNGGCRDHCKNDEKTILGGERIQEINKLKPDSNSCLNKSLCRG